MSTIIVLEVIKKEIFTLSYPDINSNLDILLADYHDYHDITTAI